MSKRKSRTKSLHIDKEDIQFPDDSSDDPDVEFFSKPQMKNLSKIELTTKATGSRISARGKKEKKIYDPSDHNGPVHKKKKEALEAAAKKFNSPIKSPAKSATPLKSPKMLPFPAKTPEKASLQSAKRKLDLDNDVALIKAKVQKTKSDISLVRPAPAASAITIMALKEPSKRIQSRQLVVSQPKPEVKPLKSILRRSISISCSENTASTVPLQENKNSRLENKKEVSKWTAKDVREFFEGIGFDKKDAAKFEEEEIDGETLLLLQRDDLQKLTFKVGVFIKAWNRIVRFQSGKDDPTQGWK